MASSQAMPEPMNASPHHSKVKASIVLADSTFVAGTYVSGKMELECRADKGLGIGIIMIELFATQELTSRDHSATSTFLHSRRLFQGPNLPPSNAVHAHPQPGYPVLPPNYHQARRGLSTFLFRIPIPETSPSSINFGSGLAKVRYELRASVGVFWKEERRLVIDKHIIDVLAAYPYADTIGGKEPEGVVVGENGKLWMHGRLVGTVIVAGESACVELQVKNHSLKKNTSLSLYLNRSLVLPGSTGTGKQAIQVSDTLTHVPFKGVEYIIPPGAEGVANLVFDVPRDSRGVRGGALDGDDTDPPHSTESLFEIRCSVDVKMSMGFTNKDIVLSIPVTIVHPLALPLPEQAAIPSAPALLPYPPPIPDAPYIPGYASPPFSNVANPYTSPYPMSPPPDQPFPYVVDQNQVWIPPPIPMSMTPQPWIQAYPPPVPHHHHLAAPIPNATHYVTRPASAGDNVAIPHPLPVVHGVSGLPGHSLHDIGLHTPGMLNIVDTEPEEGKGQRALRVTRHLRLSSRHRSVSPQSHRFPLPPQPPPVVADVIPSSTNPVNIAHRRTQPQPPPLGRTENLSLSPPIGETAAGGVVYSPRPQLTPKHSFSHNTRPKSERVEELERLADAVELQMKDLSGDLPKDNVLSNVGGIGRVLAVGRQAQKEVEQPVMPRDNQDGELNKTLPAPPVPTGKSKENHPLSPISGRPHVNSLFDDQHHRKPALAPLIPSDLTPPTPTLTAVLPTRYPRGSSSSHLLVVGGNTNNGLDALERRLLAEVGTRKLDDRKNNSSRPDVRTVLPIDIPSKSPEPLNDSAISSLTLANRAEEQDHDSDLDLLEAKTHRGGAGSGSVSDFERERNADSRFGTGDDASNMVHRRGEESSPLVPRGVTPTKLSSGKGKDKEKRNSKKKERVAREEKTRSKTAAKGRVAAWLGRIDPEVPPQEEIIPPSPSVARAPVSLPNQVDLTPPQVVEIGKPPPSVPLVSEGIDRENVQKDVSSAPNPRSSGFVPIGTLNRDVQRHLVEREMTVVEEARRIADLWSSSPTLKDQATPKFPVTIPPRATPQSIRTDRRVSPPSNSVPGDSHGQGTPKVKPKLVPHPPAVRNVWQLPPDHHTVKAKAAPPPIPPKIQKTVQPSPRSQAFPPLPSRQVDPEVKYDVRSARGGRGGKVAAVASMWASVASASTGGPNVNRNDIRVRETPKKLNTSSGVNAYSPPPLPSKPPPRLPGKVALPGLVSYPTSGTKPAVSSFPSLPAHATSTPKENANQLKVNSPTPQVRLPRKLPSVAALSSTTGGPIITARSKSTEPKIRGLFAGDFKSNNKSNASSSHTPGKATPTNLSTASLAEPRLFDLAAAKRAKPIIKSTSVPAVISSSHAVPVLSSTASLARPQVTINAKTRSERRPIVSSAPRLGLGLVSPVSGASATSTSNSVVRPGSPVKSPPGDLAFGQARLRDLIKKYQG